MHDPWVDFGNQRETHCFSHISNRLVPFWWLRLDTFASTFSMFLFFSALNIFFLYSWSLNKWVIFLLFYYLNNQNKCKNCATFYLFILGKKKLYNVIPSPLHFILSACLVYLMWQRLHQFIGLWYITMLDSLFMGFMTRIYGNIVNPWQWWQ